MIEIDCLRDCYSACCRFSKYIRFSRDEAKTLTEFGTLLIEAGDVGRDGRAEYIKIGNCGAENSGCTLYSERPQVCREFRNGSRDCLRFRAENPDAVKNLTVRDEIFQNEYFGLDE